MGPVRLARNRALAHFGVITTATITAVVAVTLLVLASVLPGSIADDALADAHAAVPITASAAYRSELWEQTDEEIRAAAQQSGLELDVNSAVWRSTFRTVGLPEKTSIVVGWLDDAAVQTELTDGRWPEPGAGHLEVTMHATALDELGLAVGDELQPEPRPGQTQRPDPITIVGAYEPADPTHPVWRDYGAGISQSAEDRFTVIGPALFDPTDQRVPELFGSSSAIWVLQPDLSGASHTQTDELAANVDELTGDLGKVSAGEVTDQMFVTSDLGKALRQAGESATSASAMLRVIVVMLALLAAWAMVFTTRLVASRRATTTALMRARGSSTRLLVNWSLILGVPLAVIAAAVAPAIASLAVSALRATRTVEATQLSTTSATAWLAAGAAATAWLIIFVMSDLSAGRSIAETSTAQARPPRRAAIQRAGLDVVLLALGVVGVQQLSRPAGETPDIVLVTAPALIALAGAGVLIRALPWLARALAVVTSRSIGVTASLGALDVARRPLQLAGVAALIVLAVTAALVSAATDSTWQRFQSDSVDLAQPVAMTAQAAVRSTEQARDVTAALDQVPEISSSTSVSRLTTGDETAADVIALDPTGARDVALPPARDGAPSLPAVLDRLPDSPGSPASVVITEAYAAHFGVSKGASVTVPIPGAGIVADVVAVVPGVPGSTNEYAVLIDRDAVNIQLEVAAQEALIPTEWWLAATDRAAENEAAAVVREVEGINQVATRSEVRAQLANPAVSDGIRVGQAGAAGFAALFLLTGLIVQTIASFRAKANEHAVMRAIGLGGRGTLGIVAMENALLLAFTYVAGCGLGLLVATLTVPHSVGGLAGLPAVPALHLSLPWSLIGIVAVGMVSLFAVLVLVAATSLRRVDVVGVLRAGADR